MEYRVRYSECVFRFTVLEKSYRTPDGDGHWVSSDFLSFPQSSYLFVVVGCLYGTGTGSLHCFPSFSKYVIRFRVSGVLPLKTDSSIAWNPQLSRRVFLLRSSLSMASYLARSVPFLSFSGDLFRILMVIQVLSI